MPDTAQRLAVGDLRRQTPEISGQIPVVPRPVLLSENCLLECRKISRGMAVRTGLR